jgi:TonB family protein
MRWLPDPERDLRPGAGKTANERLKAGGRNRYHWSIVASVAIHVAIVAGWPDFERPSLFLDAASGGALEVIDLGSLPAAPGRLLTLRPLAPEEEAAPTEEEEEEESGLEGNEDLGGLASDGGLGRVDLQRLASLTPTVIGPRPAPDPDPKDPVGPDSSEVASDGSESEGVRIREETSELSYQGLSEEELLELERLSALRPELALVSPSSWLVLQNPTEVNHFMRERFGSPGPDDETSGNLSVSLWIDEQGSVEWAEINRSSGRPDLDASALELFRRIVAFRPAREQGLRVPVAAIFWLLW